MSSPTLPTIGQLRRRRSSPRSARAKREPPTPARQDDDLHCVRPVRSRVERRGGAGPKPSFESLEVAERVDVIGEVRDHGDGRRHLEPLRPGEEALGAVAARRAARTGAAPRARARSSSRRRAATSARPPSGSAPSSASRSRGCAAGRSAFDEQESAPELDAAAAPVSTAAPWPSARVERRSRPPQRRGRPRARPRASRARGRPERPREPARGGV